MTTANTSISILWPDGSSATVMSDTNGHYSIESKNPQTSGTVTATTLDLISGIKEQSSIFYTDQTAPKIFSFTISDQDQNGKPEVFGRQTEDFGIVTITWPDGSTSTAWSDPDMFGSEATTKQVLYGLISATVTDRAGNTGVAHEWFYPEINITPSQIGASTSQTTPTPTPDPQTYFFPAQNRHEI